MLTQARLKQLLSYNQKSGAFRWRATGRGTVQGALAGYLSPIGYWYVAVDKVPYLAHRLAYLYVTGSWPEFEVDHEDHVRSNNAWLNLKPVTHHQNSKNQSLSKGNTSGVTGVSWVESRDKWVAQITVGGKNISGGRFKKFEDAVAKRVELEVEYKFHENHGK